MNRIAINIAITEMATSAWSILFWSFRERGECFVAFYMTSSERRSGLWSLTCVIFFHCCRSLSVSQRHPNEPRNWTNMVLYRVKTRLYLCCIWLFLLPYPQKEGVQRGRIGQTEGVTETQSYGQGMKSSRCCLRKVSRSKTLGHCHTSCFRRSASVQMLTKVSKVTMTHKFLLVFC